MPVRFPLIVCLLLSFSLPVYAAPTSPTNLRSDILYTSRGEFVQVSPMHPLTLNAHIQQFAYEPLGLEVAFAGSEVQGDQTVHFVKTIDVLNGREMSRLAITAPTSNEGAGYMLLGWTVSGKNLLLRSFVPSPINPGECDKQCLRWDLTTNPPTTHLIDPTVPLPREAVYVEGIGEGCVSPTGRWIVFRQPYSLPGAEGKPGEDHTAYVLYEPDRDTYRLLTLPPKSSSFRWSDDSHLRIQQGEADQQFDVVSGKVSSLSSDVDLEKPAVSKQYPDLALDIEPRDQEDRRNGGGHLDSCLVWIRRIPSGKKPLSVAAAGLIVGKEKPQAVWSPTGKQIAFLSLGDLCVTNLTTAKGLMPREKLAVGLSLTSAEEKELAMSNLKQIGLGIIQYTQDFDEHFPPSEGVNEAIYPYIKSRDVFQVGSHPFVYVIPGGTALASLDDWANTVLGKIGLTDSEAILFADGHVKLYPKQLSPKE